MLVSAYKADTMYYSVVVINLGGGRGYSLFGANRMCSTCTITADNADVVFNPKFGKTTVSVLHDAQLLLNKQQQILGGIYIH